MIKIKEKMNSLDVYNKIFKEIFSLKEENLQELKYQDIPNWDSIGHMQLMAELEKAFEIELEIDDIIDFSSYQKGQEILQKYKINF